MGNVWILVPVKVALQQCFQIQAVHGFDPVGDVVPALFRGRTGFVAQGNDFAFQSADNLIMEKFGQMMFGFLPYPNKGQKSLFFNRCDIHA